ncbi:MAG: twitch domain-containing radical SAM protein [Reichenbachiella sp.]
MTKKNKHKVKYFDKFCMMPWVHFHVDTDGLAKACCSTSVTYGDFTANGVPAIWEGGQIAQFRSQILNTGIDKRCNACIKRDVVGKSSMRSETNEKYADLIPQILKDEVEDLKPRYFDIRFSNLCNLRCRTCWHGASSSWFDEAKKLKNNLGDKAIIEASTNNFQLIEDFLSYAGEIDEIYFAGGEPLMMEEHYALLNKLIALGKTDVLLRYNTNMSQLRLKGHQAIDCWNQFSNVKLLISVDGMGDQLAYIRKGVKWQKILDNVKQVRKEAEHVQLEIAPTISLFNILSVGELHRFFVEENLIGVNDVYLNLLDRPFHYNVKSLSVENKAQAKIQLRVHIDWLKEMKTNSELVLEFEGLITFMMSEDLSSHQKAFLKLNGQLDDWRGERFENLFPELN